MLADNMLAEIDEFIQSEMDANLWRTLDHDYLLLLGKSVIIRHTIRAAVLEGMHPGYILVSDATES